MTVFDGLKLPKVIYEADSKYNGKISVIEIGQTKKLSVAGVVQSINWNSPSIDRQVWGKLVAILHEEEPALQNMLILGLGGGSMQHLLAQKFPGLHITSVEIDEIMVDVAKKYFDLNDIPNHRILVQDALRVISTPEEFGISHHSVQAIVVDIYCGENYPELGTSGNFIDGLKNLVIPGGLVVFNRIYLEHHQDQVNGFIESLEGFFAQVKSVIIAGRTNSDNVLVFCRT